MKQNHNTNLEVTIVKDIERAIQSNQFSSKERLIDYLLEVQKKGAIKEKTKLEALLNLYDRLHQNQNSPLDMSNYASTSTENADLIVSKQNDQVLKTINGASQYENEFHSVKNTMIVNNSNAQVNSEDVFEHMARYQKEELKLISIEEAISKNNVDIEILNKIRFFITHINMDIKIFTVDIITGIFYNKETDEIYEVRKNDTTNQYEIYKGSNKLYSSNQNVEDEAFVHQTDGNEISKPKVRVKKPDNPIQNGSNAAFTRIGFLIINILSFVFLTAMIILLNK